MPKRQQKPQWNQMKDAVRKLTKHALADVHARRGHAQEEPEFVEVDKLGQMILKCRKDLMRFIKQCRDELT